MPRLAWQQTPPSSFVTRAFDALLRITAVFVGRPEHDFMASVLGQMKGGAVAGAAPYLG
jgi:hypothetical protein